MRAGSIFDAVSQSVMRALLWNLPDVEVSNGTRRPQENEVDVIVFPQMWGSTALGFDGIGGRAMTQAYTVLVYGDDGTVAVYFDGRFAYLIPDSPFGRVLLSQGLEAQNMPSVREFMESPREQD